MQEIMASCRKCGNKVPTSALKLDLDEGKMICHECIKSMKMHKDIEKELHRESVQQGSQSAVTLEPKSEDKSRISHKCTSCGYKFRIDPETSKPKNCPYCNARVMGF